MPAIIYRLLCPFSKQVRYIGKTEKTLDERLKQHVSEATYKKQNSARLAWLKSLLASDILPLIELDSVVCEGDDWETVERNRIAYHRRMGAKLVNGTEGGVGLFKPSVEVRSRQSHSAKKRQWSEEGLAVQRLNGKRTSSLNTGKPRRPETVEKMRLAKTGTTHSPETKAKMSATRKNRKFSDAHRLAMSISKTRYYQRLREERLHDA